MEENHGMAKNFYRLLNENYGAMNIDQKMAAFAGVKETPEYQNMATVLSQELREANQNERAEIMENLLNEMKVISNAPGAYISKASEISYYYSAVIPENSGFCENPEMANRMKGIMKIAAINTENPEPFLELAQNAKSNGMSDKEIIETALDGIAIIQRSNRPITAEQETAKLLETALTKLDSKDKSIIPTIEAKWKEMHFNGTFEDYAIGNTIMDITASFSINHPSEYFEPVYQKRIEMIQNNGGPEDIQDKIDQVLMTTYKEYGIYSKFNPEKTKQLDFAAILKDEMKAMEGKENELQKLGELYKYAVLNNYIKINHEIDNLLKAHDMGIVWKENPEYKMSDVKEMMNRITHTSGFLSSISLNDMASKGIDIDHFVSKIIEEYKGNENYLEALANQYNDMISTGVISVSESVVQKFKENGIDIHPLIPERSIELSKTLDLYNHIFRACEENAGHHIFDNPSHNYPLAEDQIGMIRTNPNAEEIYSMIQKNIGSLTSEDKQELTKIVLSEWKHTFEDKSDRYRFGDDEPIITLNTLMPDNMELGKDNPYFQDLVNQVIYDAVKNNVSITDAGEFMNKAMSNGASMEEILKSEIRAMADNMERGHRFSRLNPQYASSHDNMYQNAGAWIRRSLSETYTQNPDLYEAIKTEWEINKIPTPLEDVLVTDIASEMYLNIAHRTGGFGGQSVVEPLSNMLNTIEKNGGPSMTDMKDKVETQVAVDLIEKTPNDIRDKVYNMARQGLNIEKIVRTAAEFENLNDMEAQCLDDLYQCAVQNKLMKEDIDLEAVIDNKKDRDKTISLE